MKKRHLLKNNYFDIIDTEIKAYMLGFLFADGCNDISNNRMVISLAEKDRSILELFSKELYGMVQLELRPPTKTYTKKGNISWSSPQIKFAIYSKRICDILYKHGMNRNKSSRTIIPFESISVDLMPHFIRGYFDGDGSIGGYLYEKRKTKKFRITILTQSSVFTSQFVKLIEEKVKIKVCSMFSERENCWRITINGNNQTKLFCDWIYGNAVIFLQRKYDKYLDLKMEVLKKINRKSSKYSGVCFVKNMKKWLAYYYSNRKMIKLGYFITEEDAHSAVINSTHRD